MQDPGYLRRLQEQELAKCHLCRKCSYSALLPNGALGFTPPDGAIGFTPTDGAGQLAELETPEKLYLKYLLHVACRSRWRVQRQISLFVFNAGKRSTLMSIPRILCLAISAILIPAGAVTAATIYQTPSWPSYDVYSGLNINSGVTQASPFTVSGDNYFLETIVLPTFDNGGSVNDFDVTLYSSVSGSPGVSLETITGVPFPSTDPWTSSVHTVTFAGTTLLLNTTEYWVGIAAGDEDAGLAWNHEPTVGLRAIKYPTGTWESNGPYGDNSGAFQVTGSAVPEPSTYAALASLGFVGLAVYRRRKRS